MARAPKLPAFISPMQAKLSTAFDSDKYLFEIKWDGTRALCFIDQGKYRFVNRRRIDMTERYPEFNYLGELPAGTLLDGEMIVLKDGKPDFSSLLSRDQARSPLKIRTLSRSMPATYMVFDILYENGRPVMDLPLQKRRNLLVKHLKKWNRPGLLLSQGVVGSGRAFFEEAVKQGLEGVVAKRLTSKYEPGKRSGAWLKIKRNLELYCVVIGFIPSGRDDFRSLILATEENDQLRYVGQVGSGFDNKIRSKINQWLWNHLQTKPVIPCGKTKGKWVEPTMICRVSCMELSARGELRAPVFKEWLQG